MNSAGSWTGWVSRRFLIGRRGGRGRLVFVFSVILIGMGVATLITILSVMNGLQQGYIRSILEIGSYHLLWSASRESASASEDVTRMISIFESDSRVALTIPFREGQTMLNGKQLRSIGTLLKGVPESLYQDDASLARVMEIVEGRFDIAHEGIVLGEELATSLGVSTGDRITALDLGSGAFTPAELKLTVRGVFRCVYREYENTLAFVSLETINALFGSAPVDIGVKLHRLEDDRLVMDDLESHVEATGGHISSWRDSNRSFFGALRTEKVMMLLLLALIFVVVAVNIDHSLRRMATERVEDLSLLKAVGATPGSIRLLFLRQGLAIGGSGAAAGVVLGVPIGANVDTILVSLRKLRYFLSNNFGFGALPSGSVDAFLRRSEVMASDVIIILLLAIIISSLSSIRAASQAALQKPAEILRSE